MAIAAPIHTGERSIDRVLGAGVPVLLVFRARPCPPCDQLDPALDRLAAEFAGAALIAKVDARDETGLVRRYGVTHLPGLVFVKDGRRCPPGQVFPWPGRPRSRRGPPRRAATPPRHGPPVPRSP